MTNRFDWRMVERFFFYCLTLLFFAVAGWLGLLVLMQFLRPVPEPGFALPVALLLGAAASTVGGFLFFGRHRVLMMAALVTVLPLYGMFGSLVARLLLEWR